MLDFGGMLSGSFNHMVMRPEELLAIQAGIIVPFDVKNSRLALL
jgi:hypothetical protein